MQQSQDLALEQILRCLRQKYQQLDGIMAATREMEALADGQDADTFGLHLSVRQNHMKRIEQIDAAMQAELAKLPPEEAAAVQECLEPEKKLEYASPLLSTIAQADLLNRELHGRILSANERLTDMVDHPLRPAGE